MKRSGSAHDRSIEAPADGVVLRRPVLRVGEIEGQSGQRRLELTVDLGVGDDLAGVRLTETIVVRAARVGDPPIEPASEPVVVSRHDFTAEAGSTELRTELIVNRSSLDVEQDWWRSGQGGETEPIAEWVDRIVAEVRISLGADVLADATTPIVEGSWGAIGHGESDHPIG